MNDRPVLDRNLDSKTFRDFFADNKGKSLEEAIKCWKYKKQLQGHNSYRRRQREISFEYLTEEKFYPLSTSDEYLKL